jgi:hypothetical protein
MAFAADGIMQLLQEAEHMLKVRYAAIGAKPFFYM